MPLRDFLVRLPPHRVDKREDPLALSTDVGDPASRPRRLVITIHPICISTPNEVTLKVASRLHHGTEAGELDEREGVGLHDGQPGPRSLRNFARATTATRT